MDQHLAVFFPESYVGLEDGYTSVKDFNLIGLDDITLGYVTLPSLSTWTL